MSKNLEKLGKVALGLFGGYLLIEILRSLNKCKHCGNQIPSKHTSCPYCGVQR